MSSQQYFDEVADQWDAMRQSFFPDEVREAALAAANVRPGDRAADIGAGSGFITEALLSRRARVVAVDQSAAMLEVMKRKLGSDTVDYRQGTAETLPIESGCLDHAFANMYLHHVEQPAAAIAEIARTLKPGGKLVITDLDEHTFSFLVEEQHDRWMGFKREEVRRWFEEAGLTEVSVTGIGSECCADSSCGTERAKVSIFLAVGVKA